jgi:hypothetical protein
VPAQQHIAQRPSLNWLVQNDLRKQPSATKLAQSLRGGIKTQRRGQMTQRGGIMTRRGNKKAKMVQRVQQTTAAKAGHTTQHCTMVCATVGWQEHTWSPKVTISNSPPAVSRARISLIGLDVACQHKQGVALSAMKRAS